MPTASEHAPCFYRPLPGVTWTSGFVEYGHEDWPSYSVLIIPKPDAGGKMLEREELMRALT
jgi:hypothetical protein